jgi:hypothetical protein
MQRRFLSFEKGFLKNSINKGIAKDLFSSVYERTLRIFHPHAPSLAKGAGGIS